MERISVAKYDTSKNIPCIRRIAMLRGIGSLMLLKTRPPGEQCGESIFNLAFRIAVFLAMCDLWT